MAAVGKFTLGRYVGKLVINNFGMTRAIQVTFDLGRNDEAADELLAQAIPLRISGGVREVFLLRTPEARYVVVAGDVGLCEPYSSDITVDRAKDVIDALRNKALLELRIVGKLETYSSV